MEEELAVVLEFTTTSGHMVTGKGISGLVSTMSMFWRRTVMLPTSQTNKGPAPRLSITEGPALLTRSCLNTEGHPRGPLALGNWCKFCVFVTKPLGTGTNADALHTCLLHEPAEAPSEVTATERGHRCMLRCCFYQHKEQGSVQVTKQDKKRT